MKAISTHFVGHTATKPARVIASDLDGNRQTVQAHGALTPGGWDGAHREAVTLLCQRMGWYGTLIPGATKDGLAWVWAETEAAQRLTIRR